MLFHLALGLSLGIVPHGTSPRDAVVAEPVHLHVADLGAAGARTRVELAVVFAYRRDADLSALLDGRTDPGAARPLTGAEFVAAFAPSPATYARVAQTFERAGFTLDRAYRNRTVLDVSAPAPLVDRFFGTATHVLRDGARIAYANVRPAVLPAALRDVVVGVAGFDDLPVAHTSHVMAPPAPDAPGGPPYFGPNGGLGPSSLEAAYDFPILHQIPHAPEGQTYDGTGRSTGVVIDADFDERDLASYLKYFHIVRTGPSTRRVLVDGGPYPGSGDAIEATLDAETIVSTAPGTALVMYEIPFLNTKGVVDAYEQAVDDGVVDALDSSFGGCEFESVGKHFPELTNHLARQARALGIAYAASSGDYGALTCPGDFPTLGVNSPASDPSFVGVGGTTLALDVQHRYSLEYGWSGSGGGVSVIFPRPAYQTPIAGTSPSGRNVPDVAFDADPLTGVSFFYYDKWDGRIGGTSLAAPLFCALATERDEVRGERPPDPVAAIYGPFRRRGYGRKNAPLFHDVTTGDNGYYNAGPGFDQVTGIGSIDAMRLSTADRY